MPVSCCGGHIYVRQNTDLGKLFVGQIQVRILKFVVQDSRTGPGEVGLKKIIEINNLTVFIN